MLKPIARLSVKIGDLVKIEGGTLRPAWYGAAGVVTSLASGWAYTLSKHDWYEVASPVHGKKLIRSDMLVALNENR